MPYEIVEEIKGTIVGVRKVQDKGRIQIPKGIRDELGISDGDSVYWVSYGGRHYIAKAGELAALQR